MPTFEKEYSEIQDMIAQGHQEMAREKLEKFIAHHEDYAPAHFDLGNLYYAAGQLDNALIHFEKSVELSPDETLYLKNFADLLYSEEKDIEKSLSLYDQILSLRPDDVQALMMVGHLHVSLERFEQALGYYNRILDIEPWNDEAVQFVERILQQTGDNEETMDPESAYRRCQELVDSGQTEAALAGLKTLVDKHPEFALAYNDLGVLYFQSGDKQRCLQFYETAVKLQPENTNFRKNLADFYLVENGEIEKALEVYLSVLNDDPEDIDVLMVAGKICSAMGKTESAKIFYERVIDVEPWNLEASDCLEKLADS